MNLTQSLSLVKDMLSMWAGIPGKISEQWMRFYKSFPPVSFPFGTWWKLSEGQKLPFDSLSLYEEWKRMTGETLERVIKLAPSPPGVGAETLMKTFDGLKSYFSLYEFWVEWVKIVGPLSERVATEAEWKEVQEKLRERYKKVLDTVVGTKPPESVVEMQKIRGKLVAEGLEILSWFRSPWLAAAKGIPQVAAKAITGDISAIREGFSLWQTAVSDTIGKLLHIPSLGYSREYEERTKDLVDAYVKFATSLPGFYSEFYQAGMKAFEKILEKAKDIPANNTPESFKKFYSLWLRTNEDTFYDLFKKEEFANLMNEVLKRGLDFKKKLDGYVSKFLESLSVPNREEMNDVYKALYDLRKEVRELAREIRQMKGGEQASEVK